MKKRSSCVCGYEGRKDSVLRHKNTCKALSVIETLQEKVQKLEGEQSILPIIQKLEHELEQTKAELHEANIKLKEKDQYIEKLLNKTKVTNINNNINIYNVCPFGQEPQLAHKDVAALLKMPAESVPKYIQMKHFDSENGGNVRIPNIRSNIVQVVEEDAKTGHRKWVKRDKTKTISDMAERNLDELVEKHGAKGVAIWKQWYEGSGLAKDGYDKTKEWRDIIKKVELVLLNNRE